MGALTSRQNADVEETDIGSNHAYKYPPKSGNYFGSHFIMGGERFDTPQPEAYLFGENADLNFLGSRPTAFPYPPPQANEPTKTLKCLINIRKESVRFVKAPDSATKIHGDGTGNKGNSFNIEFVYDSDAKCAITVYYFCTEDVTSNGLSYLPRDPSLTSETYHCKRGVNQLFSQNSHIFNPNLFSDEDLSYNSERDVFPVAIHCVVEEVDMKQSHTTVCVVDHHTDGTYVLRALKQKIFVDSLCYLLQEIYGIENKNINKASIDDDTDDNGSECVICMSDTRDTLILPCRHLCLCNSCADSLRYQANNCPICRAPFRALLQIRAVQKSITGTTNVLSPQSPQDGDNIPPGYTPVSLIEALNGPPQVTVRNPTTTDIGDGSDADAVQAAEILNRSLEHSKDQEKNYKEKSNANPPQIRMSVLLTKEDGNVTKHSATSNTMRDKSPRPKTQSRSQQNRDSVKIINEKNAANLQPQDPDDDSDAEKLSPLLDPKSNENINNNIQNSALHMDGVDESIDDTDTDIEEHNENNARTIIAADGEAILAGAEDSDYYTPEDPHTTILSPLCPEKNKPIEPAKSKENLSVISSTLTAIKENINSSPDSPISGSSTISTRSSGDSYSSSSSTRQLLSSVPANETPIRILDVKMCDDKQHSLDKAVHV